MKLNNRGWGLQVMMIFILILMICLVIISALVNKNFKELTDNDVSFDYSKLENKVVEASKKYIEQKEIKIENNDTYTISISKLQKEKLMSEIRDDFSKCTGYSVVENKNNKLTYNAYIKCGQNYKTKNYSSDLDI